MNITTIIFIVVIVLGILFILGNLLMPSREGMHSKKTDADSGSDDSPPDDSGSSGSGSSGSGSVDIYSKTFYAANGGTAKVVNINGVTNIRITSSTGQVTDYLIQNTSGQAPPPPPANPSSFTAYVFVDSAGDVARIYVTNSKCYIEVTCVNGEVLVFTESQTDVYNPNGNQSYKITTVDGSLNQGGEYPAYSTSASYVPPPPPPPSSSYPPSQNQSGAYNSTMPPGVPYSSIPPGQEDLYILKSQVVAPVCPVCPSNKVEVSKPCPPCPACARCPDSNFACKKVPNYASVQIQTSESGSGSDTGLSGAPSNYEPMPMVDSFAAF